MKRGVAANVSVICLLPAVERLCPVEGQLDERRCAGQPQAWRAKPGAFLAASTRMTTSGTLLATIHPLRIGHHVVSIALTWQLDWCCCLVIILRSYGDGPHRSSF
jgi:hypothetical protein